MGEFSDEASYVVYTTEFFWIIGGVIRGRVCYHLFSAVFSIYTHILEAKYDKLPNSFHVLDPSAFSSILY